MEESIQRAETIESLTDLLREQQKLFANAIVRLLRDLISTIIFIVGAGYISTRVGTIPMILLFVFQADYMVGVVIRTIELIEAMRMTQKLCKIVRRTIEVFQEGDERRQLGTTEE